MAETNQKWQKTDKNGRKTFKMWSIAIYFPASFPFLSCQAPISVLPRFHFCPAKLPFLSCQANKFFQGGPRPPRPLPQIRLWLTNKNMLLRTNEIIFFTESLFWFLTQSSQLLAVDVWDSRLLAGPCDAPQNCRSWNCYILHNQITIRQFPLAADVWGYTQIFSNAQWGEHKRKVLMPSHAK